MYCKNCGHKLSDSAKFCDNCSNSVESTNIKPLFHPGTATRRLINLFLDRAISYAILIILFTLLSLVVTVKESQESIIGIFALLFFVFYTVITEFFWQKTLAKFITKTKVVTLSGDKPTFGQILLRTICRYIPFEPFSFLSGAYPMGWHDRLSKTLVVPSEYTKEDVQKINIEEVKKQSPTGTIFGILIAVFVAIAVIGILSSVVLASLTTARQKGQEAAVKVSLSDIRNAAERYSSENSKRDGYDFGNSNSCNSGMFSSTDFEMIKSGIKNAVVKHCFATTDHYALSVLLGDKSYCVDDTGYLGLGTAEISLEIKPSAFCNKKSIPTANGETVGGQKMSTYTYEEAGFSAVFPSEPSRTLKKGMYPDKEDAAHVIDVYKYKNSKDTLFEVIKYGYSTTLAASEADAALDAYVQSLLDAAPGTKLVSSEYSYIGKNRSIEFYIKDPKNSDEAHGKFVLSGKDTYLIFTIYKAESGDGENYKTFIDSLKILQ